MLKDFRRGELLAGVFLRLDCISASSLLCLRADSWGSSLISKAVHVLSWNRRTCALSRWRAWSSRARVSSVCSLSFANACHSARWKIRVWIMSSCSECTNPLNTGIAHYRMYVSCGPQLCAILILTCKMFSKCHARHWLVSETLSGKCQIASPKDGIAVNLKEKSIPCTEMWRFKENYLSFKMSMQLGSITWIMQGGLEHTQFKLV